MQQLRENAEQGEKLWQANAAASLTRRPSELRWSAAECIEHLNLPNRAFLPRIDAGIAELSGQDLRGAGPFRMSWKARLLKYWLEPPSRLPAGMQTEFSAGRQTFLVSAWWRTSMPSVRKSTSSEMLVEWSAMRSRLRATDIKSTYCGIFEGSACMARINSR